MSDAQAIVDLKAIETNARILREISPVMAVVKANAYGHGAVKVAEKLTDVSDYLAVATAGEAIELRKAGISKSILLLCTAKAEMAQKLIDFDITLTISSVWELENLPSKAKIHLKINTGLNRLGVKPDEALQILKLIRQKKIELEGICTHLIDSEEIDPIYSLQQLELFEKFVKTEQISAKFCHVANTGAVINQKLQKISQEISCNLARPGIGLYGYSPNPNLDTAIKLKPAMTVQSWVMLVKTVEAGEVASYNALWTAKRKTKLATIRFGYADGYHRLLSNKGKVLINGQICPVVGRVCMDQIVVDVGELDVQPGDQAIIFTDQVVTAQTLAELAETNVYEILTSVSRRVERIYV